MEALLPAALSPLPAALAPAMDADFKWSMSEARWEWDDDWEAKSRACCEEAR